MYRYTYTIILFLAHCLFLCLVCLVSPHQHFFPPQQPHTPPISSLASSSDNALALPHEATRARTAFIATHLLEQAEGSISCPQEDTRARLAPITVVSREQSEGHTPLPYEDTRVSARTILASHRLTKSEGINLRVRDFAAFVPPPSHHASLSVSWPLPLVTMSVAPSIFSLPASSPQPTFAPSRFASPNRFAVLSDHTCLDVSPPAPVEPPKPSPSPTQALSSTFAPPLIADTCCTGLLLQFPTTPR